MKLFIFFFSVVLFAQQKITITSIDEKLKKSETLFSKGQTDNVIKLNLSILEDSRSINYPKGRALACYNLALAFNGLYRYNKSNYYLKLMEAELENIHEDDEEIAMNILYSNNYTGVKMYDEALKKLRGNLLLANNIKIDSNRCYVKSLALLEMGKNYTEKKRYDSATYYYKRAIEELKTQKKLNSIFGTNLKIGLLYLAGVKFKENKIDSTEFYLKSAQSLPVRVGNYEYMKFKLSGQIHSVKQEYDSAIADYKESIGLAVKLKNPRRVLELYSLISEAYEKTGQVDEEKKYLLKYNTLHDSLKVIEDKNIEDTVGLLVEEKQKPLHDKNNLLSYILFIGIAGVIIIIFFVGKKIRNKNKILNIREQETFVLSQKLNLAFEEVVQLAKNNDPEFLTRFQEVYPGFFPNLLKIEPQLLHTELKFCALLFLNFSTKDIASYTFVQPQSIQTRKNRLRKKLNIPSDEDIYLWMKNINSK